MSRDLTRSEKYNAAVVMLDVEVSTFWSINQTFLLGETLLAGFLLQASQSGGLSLAASGLGVLIGLLWMMAVSRSADYHKLRAMQVRSLEDGAQDGVMTQGNKFRKDNVLTLAGETHRARLLGRIPIRVTGICLALGFLGFFAFAFVASL